ncbi:MAG: uracil-DNA glycosylase [Legionella sp.]|nr:uracil-DNA glycosylase [Legionella sp.]
MTKNLDLTKVDSDWRPMLEEALSQVDADYLKQLKEQTDWLPGLERMFAAFQLPLTQVRYILLGESPYPRVLSANGYAFWDDAVGSLWSDKGLSTAVNRATSLRNLLKMFFIARGDLSTDNTSQEAIAQLNKEGLVQTGPQLFNRFMQQGFLLLNASLVFSEGKVPFHARQWKPFMNCLFSLIHHYNPDIQLVLFGRIAEAVHTSLPVGLVSEHPYNISFITNPDVIRFFQPLDLLTYEPINN